MLRLYLNSLITSFSLKLFLKVIEIKLSEGFLGLSQTASLGLNLSGDATRGVMRLCGVLAGYCTAGLSLPVSIYQSISV